MWVLHDCILMLLFSFSLGRVLGMRLQNTHLCLLPIKRSAPSLAQEQEVIKHAKDIIAGLVDDCCGGDTHVGHLQRTGGGLLQHLAQGSGSWKQCWPCGGTCSRQAQADWHTAQSPMLLADWHTAQSPMLLAGDA